MAKRDEPGRRALDALARDRQEAIALVQAKGTKGTRALLEQSARDLEQRLRRAEGLSGPGEGSFTAAQLRATLAQVKLVLRSLVGGLKGELLDRGEEAADAAADHTASHLAALDKEFRGVGRQPLALNEARMFEVATSGVRSSLLHRLASSGEPAATGTEVEEPHPAKVGILQRYGVEGIKNFEATLQRGLVAKKSWRDMRADITAESPFLQGAPAHWAARIVRTEVMGAYGRAAWEASREADDQLGDVIRILSATFDDRTGPDSANVHGEVRRAQEAFEYVKSSGEHEFFVHPPNRPNDREIVVTWRRSWGPAPAQLRSLSTDRVTKFYARAKQIFPGRPEVMSTVKGFGDEGGD